MNFEEFKLYVSEAVTSALGDDYEYTHTQVIKNNGIRLTGLSVHRTGNTISPTFYLEGFYESYKKGESLKSIIDTLAEGYSRYEIEEAPDLDFITDYEEVSKRIMIKLVNYEKNKDFLCFFCTFLRFFSFFIIFAFFVFSILINSFAIFLQKFYFLFFQIYCFFLVIFFSLPFFNGS